MFTVSIGMLVLFLGVFIWTYFFWSKSYFIITNQKISIKVRNGLFSKYHISLYYKNIKDIAYSKNNILHYFLDCGTFFARSSAGSVGDFEGPWLPEVEKIYKYVNNIYLLDDAQREALTTLEIGDLSESSDVGVSTKDMTQQDTFEEITRKEKSVLLSIQGIKEVVLLDNADRGYIFEHEEERNHGVYECLKKKVLFAMTHDNTFRNPDEAIVFQKGKKVIFPTVGFHEIKRSGVISSSPGLIIHTFLSSKFQHLAPDDATLLVGFDI